MRIGFIINANNNIGIGHLERCLVLAEIFKKKEFKIFFITESDLVINKIKNEFFGYKKFNYELKTFKNSLLKFLNKNKISVLIVDLPEKKYQKINFLSKTKILIVSFTMFFYQCQRYEDISFFIGLEDVSKKYIFNQRNKKIDLYSGEKYLIFRNEFRNKKKTVHKKIGNKILLTMGGGDPENFTFKVARAIEKIRQPIKCIIILGSAMKKKSDIKKFCLSASQKFVLKENVVNIAKLMVESDFAIINGGSTRYEIASLGVPFIAISLHKTQFKITQKLINSVGAGINLGVGKKISIKKISNVIVDMVNSKKNREVLSKKTKKSMDTFGAERIALIIKNKINKKVK